MTEFFKRSITGILYTFLLLSAVFLSNDAFDFLFLIFGLICLYELKKITKLSGYYIFIAFLTLWWLFVYLIQEKISIHIFLLLTLTINLFLITHIFSKKQKIQTNTQKFIINLFYLGGGFIFLTKIPYNNNQFSEFLIIGIFILISINDSFAYLTGKLIGKHHPFKHISPKKTTEGFIGGFIFSILAAYILSLYDDAINTKQWMLLAIITTITGNLGDLLESKFKRDANVKDSGAILPGHGGLLDRLDSLVFAAPFIYVTLKIFKYVS